MDNGVVIRKVGKIEARGLRRTWYTFVWGCSVGSGVGWQWRRVNLK